MPEQGPGAASVLRAEIEQFIRHLNGERRVSPHTSSAYRRDLGQLEAFLAQRLGRAVGSKDVDKLQLRAWLGELAREHTSSSIARKLAAVRTFYRYLRRSEPSRDNPAQGLATPRVRRPLPLVLRAEAAAELVQAPAAASVPPEIEAALRERDRLMLELLYGCGLRVSELVSLDKDALSEDGESIGVLGKGRKERNVPVGECCRQAFERYLPERAHLRHPKTGFQDARALLLGRRISVAGAEKRVAELEALGRSVLLAALDGRYVGLLALQDGIAAGGRAAVQYLIDAEVEAILLSGEARDTCNALAHHLGIDHVRPEVAPEDRASELRRLADSTPDLAVVGRASKDDAVLGAVPLSINIEGAGGALERWDIDVASGDARDAAWAVHLARKLYADTTRSIVAASAPALVALLASLLGLPAWLAPLAGVAGSALLIQRLKRRSRRPIVASAIRQRAPAASS